MDHTLHRTLRLTQPRSVKGLTVATIVDARRPDALDKSLPVAADGATVAEFLACRPRLSAFSTPLLVLTSSVIDANVTRMARWCAARGVDLAPHGKTTMAPAIWQRQLRAGAWGITVATPSQLRVAVASGVRRIQLANALVDPVGLTRVSAALDADAGLQVLSWVDSVDAVEAMTTVLAGVGPRRPLTVLVELGAPGGRTGARDLPTAQAVAAAVAASPHLVLGGVSGYEGALAHDASPGALHAVRGYLGDLAALHRALVGAGAYSGASEVVVTAGGSAYFDNVAGVLGPLADPAGAAGVPTRVLLRPGAYVIHDDGFYRGISPFSRDHGEPLRSAMHAWARVVSRPEPALALLDAGKRDVPFDEGLPEPQLVADRLGGPVTRLSGAEITAVNDQHCFLRIDPASTLRVGQVVRLGLSHPCTAFDKWQWIPVIADDAETDPVVVDLLRTYF
ncbi:amino acid deaminase [Pseudonocardia xinjiangensis]|uniref:amino acid deaminase n=1 Tax=Pseudonocardia xinjiangensis TaxID=75289 RepID=UPI0028AF9604|nr:amino acid deaminase [Pseudonocardia xinjiangensis]